MWGSVPISVSYTHLDVYKRQLQDIMKSYAQEYGVKIVATTQRTVLSPRKHNFTSVLYSCLLYTSRCV